MLVDSSFATQEMLISNIIWFFLEKKKFNVQNQLEVTQVEVSTLIEMRLNSLQADQPPYKPS